MAVPTAPQLMFWITPRDVSNHPDRKVAPAPMTFFTPSRIFVPISGQLSCWTSALLAVNRLVRKPPTDPMAPSMVLPMPTQSRALMPGSALLKMPRMLSPRVLSPSMMLPRMVLPRVGQSVLIRPFQMAVMISGIRATSCGMPWIRPAASCTAASMPAGISCGSASMMPPRMLFSRSMPVVSSVGRFAVRKDARLVTSVVATPAKAPTFSVSTFTMVCSRSMAAGSSACRMPGSSAPRVPTTWLTTALITGMYSVTVLTTWLRVVLKAFTRSPTRPGISAGSTPCCSAQLTRAMLSAAVSTSGWKMGIRFRPMAVFRLSVVAVMRCMLSSKEPIFARFSSVNTVPMACASLEYCCQASAPASISGFSSFALLPNRSMARASRSDSLAMPPRAVMASQNTSSVPRMLPSAFWKLTPSLSKLFFAVSLPPAALLMFRSSLVMLPVTVSTLVSTKRLA